jgi:hypothetical protein
LLRTRKSATKKGREERGTTIPARGKKRRRGPSDFEVRGGVEKLEILRD